MRRIIQSLLLWIVPVAGLLVWVTLPLIGQSGTTNTEWRSYGGDLANTRYSPVDQVTAGNFANLEIAWRFKTDNLGPRPEFNLESTPLVANGVLYSTAGTRRAVVALDAATGEFCGCTARTRAPRHECTAHSVGTRAGLLDRRS